MEDLGFLIVLCLLLMFGAPILLIIAGLFRMRRKRDSAKALIIVGVAWLIIGTGICATILMS